MFRQNILVQGWFDHEGLNDLTPKPHLSVRFFVAMILWHTCEVESIGKSLPIVKEIAHLPPLRFSPVFFSPPPAFSPEDLNKEIQMYQGKAPDKARAVLAISHRRMPRPKVCESNFCSLYWGLISARMITSLHIKRKTSTLLSMIIIGPERPSTERRMLTV